MDEQGDEADHDEGRRYDAAKRARLTPPATPCS